MARSLVDRIRRWLAGKPRRLLVTGGLAIASMTIVSVAAANQAPPAHAAAVNAPAHAPGEVQEATSAAENFSERAMPEHEDHHPPAFNFADRDRYDKEKADAANGMKDKRGEGVVPVTPYVYLLINTALLFWIYYRVGKKPIVDGLQARRDTVAKELDDAAKIKAEAKAKLDEYAARIGKLDEELTRIKSELIASGEAERDRIVKEAEQKAARMRHDAEFLLTQEMKQLRSDLIVQTVDEATAAAAAVLRARVSPEDHARVAEEFLAQLKTPAGKEAVS